MRGTGTKRLGMSLLEEKLSFLLLQQSGSMSGASLYFAGASLLAARRECSRGGWPRNTGSVVLIWNSRVAAQINGLYLRVGFMSVWENTAILPKPWLCQSNPVFSLKD